MFSTLFILVIASASSKLVIDFARFLFDDDNHGFLLVKRKIAKYLFSLKAQDDEDDDHHDNQAGRPHRRASEAGGPPGGRVCHQCHLEGRGLPSSPGE